jgi:hypothetical protein
MAVWQREIFGLGGPSGYKMYDVVLDAHIKEGYLLVRDPKTGHEYVAVPAMGTWKGLSPYDMLYKLKYHKERIAALEKELLHIRELT